MTVNIRPSILILIVILALFALSPIAAHAELKPEQVAILAMADSEESRHIAEYYAKARGIPQSHILLLEGKPKSSMSREHWERKVRPEILDLLKQNDLDEKIRCMVTCWDVPLKINSISVSSPEFRQRQQSLEKERADLIDKCDKMFASIESFGLDQPARKRLPLLNNTTEERLRSDFNMAMQKMHQRMQTDSDKARAGAAMRQYFLLAYGNEGSIKILSAQTKADKQTSEQNTQLAMAIGRMQMLTQVISEMEILPISEATHDLILDFVQIRSGLFGAISWIDQHMQLLKKNESHSSFDSELSMIFYPDYSPVFWILNPMHYAYDQLHKRRILMVSRLEAPSVEIVERMIDDAVATEKEGLKGNVYIDARGLKPKSRKSPKNSYYTYDQSLRDLAQRLRQHTSLTVVSDNHTELFQPGDCPDAALYCGWYSVRQYIDAFDWNRGAVAYHLASWEAKWLRKPSKNDKPGEKPWCPWLLQDGVCATLGPVVEPYLSAFPLPDDFFSLLLTGKMTLAEIYYCTKRYNSWTLVLIGDPLYTPYKNNPMLEIKNLPDRLLKRRSEKSEQVD